MPAGTPDYGTLAWAQYAYATAGNEMEAEMWRRRVVELGGVPDEDAPRPTDPASTTAPELLGIAVYNPVSITNRDAPYGAVTALAPAGELDVDVTVPDNGKLLVRLNALCASLDGGNRSENYGVKVDGVLSGSSQVNGNGDVVYASVPILVEDLDPGAVVTLQFVHFPNGSNGATRVFAGGTGGPCSIEAWALSAE